MRRLQHPGLDEVELPTVLSAMADPVRLEILRTLADGKEHVQADFRVPVGQSTLSHHMAKLRSAGVVVSRPEGTRCLVSLRRDLRDRFPGLVDTVLDLYAGPRAPEKDGVSATSQAVGSGRKRRGSTRTPSMLSTTP